MLRDSVGSEADDLERQDARRLRTSRAAVWHQYTIMLPIWARMSCHYEA